MNLTSGLAIWFLLWVTSALLVLPFGLRTHDDEGAETVPGQVTSAPVNFSAIKVAKRATLLSLGLFALYYANYVQGWLTIDDIDVTRYLL